MSYPTTILTYHQQSDADVDKSLLESHGITVYLMNANVSRAEIGMPFHVQLQVAGEDVAQAVAILREFSPQRFGSAENVKKIEAGIRRSFLRFLIGGIGCSLVLFLFVIDNESVGAKAGISLINGFAFWGVASLFYAVIKPKKKSD